LGSLFSGESALHRRRADAPTNEAFAGERSLSGYSAPTRGMLAGADLFPGGRTPAKPSCPEVIFFGSLFSGESVVHRRSADAPTEEALAGERSLPGYLAPAWGMLAGADLFPGGRTPAKPSCPEVIFFWSLFSGESAANRRRAAAPTKEALAGERSPSVVLFSGQGNVGRRRLVSRRPNSGEA
jgi:hypothetical protein